MITIHFYTKFHGPASKKPAHEIIRAAIPFATKTFNYEHITEGVNGKREIKKVYSISMEKDQKDEIQEVIKTVKKKLVGHDTDTLFKIEVFSVKKLGTFEV